VEDDGFCGLASVTMVLVAESFPARAKARVGTLSCDVSAGIGLIVFQKLDNDLHIHARPSRPDRYTGQIAEYGAALSAVEKGQLIWGVIAEAEGMQMGALAGTYAGVGLGANVLIGGSGGPSHCNRFR
jgi:hypothetical protein